MISCPFGRFQYTRLPFGPDLAGDVFYNKNDELLSGMLKVFHIPNDILIAGFDELAKDHDGTLEKTPWVCRQVNLKLNRDKWLFRWTSIPFFGEIMSWPGVSPGSRQVQVFIHMPPPKTKKGLQSFLGILNYLSKFWPMPEEVCEPLQKLTSGKTKWTWNRMYHSLDDKTKKIVKKMHTGSSMTWLDYYTQRPIHLVSALEQIITDKWGHKLWA